MMQFLTKAAWIITALCAVAAGFQFLDTMTSANSAPQQAAGMAMALAQVVIPYCFARALDAIPRPLDQQHTQTKLLAAIANSLSPTAHNQPDSKPAAAVAGAKVCQWCGTSNAEWATTCGKCHEALPG